VAYLCQQATASKKGVGVVRSPGLAAKAKTSVDRSQDRGGRRRRLFVGLGFELHFRWGLCYASPKLPQCPIFLSLQPPVSLVPEAAVAHREANRKQCARRR
jgi:hypothetical protein